MSHVDEGELTAYADGAWAPHEAEAQRIAQHLAECANCRNRLAQAQSLSARASEILAVASPVHVTVPPFEQLRADATPRRLWTAPPLAWAATVILALGIGWFGRGAVPRVDTRNAAFDQSAESMSEQPQQDAVMVPTPEPVPSVTPETAPRPTLARARTGRTEGATIGSAAGAGAAESDMAGQFAATAPTVETAARDREVAEESAAFVPRDQVASKAVITPAAPPPAATPPPMTQAANSALAERRVDGAARASAPAEFKKEGAVEHITIAEAERRGLELHFVPELEVLRVGVASKGLIIEQKLGDGKLLTITQTTIVARDVTDAAGVIVMRNGITVKVTGPVARDSLRVLAEKIR